jgi:hypothetical protein
MTQSGKIWTQTEIQQLRELAGTLTAPQISLQIGRSASGISKQIKKLGLPSFKPAGKPIPAAPEAPRASVKLKTYLEPRDGLRQAPKPKETNWPPMEICPVHKIWVSDWAGHVARLGNTCSRPAA